MIETIIAIIAVTIGASIGVIVGRASNRPAAPDLDGLIEQVRSYPKPEEAAYMIALKITGKHLQKYPTKKEKKQTADLINHYSPVGPNPATGGVDS